jgi:hypothetical protein
MKVTRENISTHLIEYQLNMVGKTIEDVKEDPQWYYNNPYSREQYLEFRAYAIPLIKKTLKCNKSKAEQAFDFFNLNFGLRVLPTKEEHEQILKLVQEDLQRRGQ